MGGQFLSNKELYKNFLISWIENSIKNKSWEKHQDLHIDEIASEFGKKSNWIDGSLFIYETILNLINSDLYGCLLVIPLSYSNKQTNITLLTWDNIRASLDLTPPSFYLFPNGEENYEDTIKSLTFLENLSNSSTYKIFFKQNEEFEDEYNRSIYVIRR